MENWQKAQQKDEKAILEILHRADKAVYAAIYKYVKVPLETEELHQEGMLVVYESIFDYDPKKGVPFWAYIHMKLRYYFLDCNRRKVHRSLEEETADGCTLGDTLMADIDIEEDFLFQEEREILRNALDTLTDRERKCVIGYYVYHLSMTEVAQSQGIAYRTAINAKTRGLEKLRKVIGQNIEYNQE